MIRTAVVDEDWTIDLFRNAHQADSFVEWVQPYLILNRRVAARR